MWIYKRKVYKEIDDQTKLIKMTADEIERSMNDCGLEGWEAYSVNQNKNIQVEWVVWFKKWLPEDEV